MSFLMHKNIRRALLALSLSLLVFGIVSLGNAQSSASSHWGNLLEASLKEKKGLTFYINGETVPGIVTTYESDRFVEVKNQTHSRIIIRLDSVDAIAMN